MGHSGHTRTRPDARVALADALRNELTRTPLSRITVRGLTRDAGVTRQTFYYHFATLNDLVVWTFKHEFADRILSHASYDEWSDGFLSMLVWMHEHPDETLAVAHSISQRELQLFLHSQLRAMMVAIVDELDTGYRIDDADREFIIDHFTLSVLGHLNYWMATSMRADPYILVDKIERILHGQVRRSLELFSTQPG